LLDRFRLSVGSDAVELPRGLQRLLAFVALRPAGGLSRDLAAGTLWPDVSEQRAQACLRTAISRLLSVAPGVLTLSPRELALARHVEVDLREAEMVARGILDQARHEVDGALARVSTLSADLLPGW
jgi:DNA-binding SARP family transcriptional activator